MATLTATPPSDPLPSKVCAECSKPLTKQSVRALQSAYHYDCFKCWVCSKPLASVHFFPLEQNGKLVPVCERDYFKRLDLTCRTCGEALRDTYIVAADSKYHLDHFTCSQCPTHFGPDDLYYEHEGNVLCHYHYSTQYAIRCKGCSVTIFKQFVEGDNNERWHAECYMINKFWNVRLSDFYGQQRYALCSENPAAMEKMERDTEEKVYQIWTVLSAFEESSAATISDMLLHVSIGKYIDGVNMAKRFIDHVHILFQAIDLLDGMYAEKNEQGPNFKKEARALSRKTVDFFALLSQTQETGLRRIGITQDLLSLITALANNLKSLIRLGLKSALTLEQQYDVRDAVSVFLKQLRYSRLPHRYSNNTLAIGPKVDFTTDLCYRCNKIIEEGCVRMKRYRWHQQCFSCKRCDEVLSNDINRAVFDVGSLALFCNRCHGADPEKSLLCFELVSLLEQYSFLLWVSLCRLDNLLRSSESTFRSSEDSIRSSKQSPRMEDPKDRSLRNSRHANTFTEGDKQYNAFQPSDIKDMRSGYSLYKVFRSSSRSSRRANTIRSESNEHPNSIPEETAPTVEIETSSTKKAKSLAKRFPQRRQRISIFGNPLESRFSKQSLVSEPNGLDARPSTAGPKLQSTRLKSNPSVRRAPSMSPDQCKLQTYLAELTKLQYMVAKHAAVLQLEPLVHEEFTMDELLELVEQRRGGLWNKLFSSLKANRRGVKPTATFAVPLDTLVERYGVTTKLGFGPCPLKLPRIFSDSILRMRQLDMTVEGIFRKNGNIRVLQELVEDIDNHPNGQQVQEETNSIQLAALFKKFLRSLPDPLLTQKLYRLFIYSQSLESEEDRRKALHLLCCMLPQTNRDCLEALSDFLQWVSSFSSQNKMDIKNLATVITPNILYQNGPEPDRQEIITANQAVEMLLRYQGDFCLVPIEIEPAIHNKKVAQFFEENHHHATRDFPKVYSRLTRAKDNQIYATVPPTRTKIS